MILYSEPFTFICVWVTVLRHGPLTFYWLFISSLLFRDLFWTPNYNIATQLNDSCFQMIRYYVLMGFIYDWCEERFEIQSVADDILAKFVSAHVNIFYCFGGTVLTSFIFQAASGFALTIYYRPTVIEAFTSIQLILYTIDLGWFIRSIHRWSSSVMIIILILHLGRVYLTGGFKKPKELIWTTGVILAVRTVSFGVTGYSLPWDQIGYWASKIVTSVPEALDNLISGVGDLLVLCLRGGFSISQLTLTRFYSVHTFVLPLITFILLILHFSILRKQGISGPL